MKRTLLFSTFSLFLVLGISSCRQDVQIPSSCDVQFSRDKELISLLGFDVSSIQETKDFYIVEEDILLNKKLLQDYIGLDAQTRQLFRTQTGRVSVSPSSPITVKVDDSIPASGEDDWREAVREALYEWNNIDKKIVLYVLNIQHLRMPT